MAALFEVSSELSPGVVRAGVGVFVPGKEFYWPEDAVEGDNPSLKLIPKNAEAFNMLEERYRGLVAEIGATKVMDLYGPPPTPLGAIPDVFPSKKGGDHPEQKTARQMSELDDAATLDGRIARGKEKGKGKRAADSK